MNEDQIDGFRSGYRECRMVIVGELNKILKLYEYEIPEISKLIYRLEEDEKMEHWESIQRVFPGITREEYEDELESSMAEIREKYYRKDGTLKVRLVRSE